MKSPLNDTPGNPFKPLWPRDLKLSAIPLATHVSWKKYNNNKCWRKLVRNWKCNCFPGVECSTEISSSHAVLYINPSCGCVDRDIQSWFIEFWAIQSYEQQQNWLWGAISGRAPIALVYYYRGAQLPVYSVVFVIIVENFVVALFHKHRRNNWEAELNIIIRQPAEYSIHPETYNQQDTIHDQVLMRILRDYCKWTTHER